LLQRSDTRVPPQQAHESPPQGVGCSQRRLSQTRPAAGCNYSGRSLRSVCQQQRERQLLTMSFEGSTLARPAQEACSRSRPGPTFGWKRDATAFRRTTFKALWEVSASSRVSAIWRRVLWPNGPRLIMKALGSLRLCGYTSLG